MEKLKNMLDDRYKKISIYTICTLTITFVLCILVYKAGGPVKKILNVIGLVLQPIIFGGVIAYLIAPLVSWLEKKINNKHARGIAVAICMLLLVLFLIALGFILVSLVSQQISGLHFSDIQALYESYQDQVMSVWERIQGWLGERDITAGSVAGQVTGAVSNVTSFLTTALFSLIFCIYFLLDAENLIYYWGRVLRIFCKPETLTKSYEILQDADKCFSGYIRGQLLDALLMGTMTVIIMTICKVPHAFVIGFLTGFGNLIPYFGPVVGILSLVIVCLTEGAYHSLLVGGIILVIVMTIDGNLINPKLLSSSISVHPLLVFCAMIAGSAVGGLAGMLVAVPLAALLKIEFDKYLDKKEAEKAAQTA